MSATTHHNTHVRETRPLGVVFEADADGEHASNKTSTATAKRLRKPLVMASKHHSVAAGGRTSGIPASPKMIAYDGSRWRWSRRGGVSYMSAESATFLGNTI